MKERLRIEDDMKVTLRRPRLKFRGRCFKWKMVEIWNQLEEETRKETVVGCFKRKMKTWILEKRPKEPDEQQQED